MRRLAAIDMALLGRRVILAEYAGGVLLSLAMGVVILWRAQSYRGIAWGCYLLGLGFNYLPMWIYALSFPTRESAADEMAGELAENKKAAMSKYRKLSLLLLVPFLAAALGLGGAMSRKADSR